MRHGRLDRRTGWAADASLVCEPDSAGNVAALNSFGPNGLLSRRTGSATTFYQFDPQGNAAQKLNASQTVLSSSIYDAFGSAVSTSTQADPFNYGAQWGYYTDLETNGILLGHRYYDTSQCRFVNRDPIGYSGGINLYGLCSNNPLGAIDPTGLSGAPQWGQNLAAFGDGMTGGLTRWMRDAAFDLCGYRPNVDTHSTQYGACYVVGTLTTMYASCGATSLGLPAVGGATAARVAAGGAAAGIAVNRANGKDAEAALQQEVGGESGVVLNTSSGRRIVDVLSNGVAYEAKVGRTSLTSFAAQQVRKDQELLGSERVNSVEWHFYTSPVTGLGGPSAPLAARLQGAGITVVIH